MSATSCDKTLWLVDDSEADQTLFRYAFSELYDSLDLRTMYSAEEALLALDEGFEPSLVLLDLNMPGEGGMHFLKQRRDRGYLNFPVVVVSSSSSQSDIRNSYTLGANSYALKPANLVELKGFAKGMLGYWTECAQLPRSSE